MHGPDCVEKGLLVLLEVLVVRARESLKTKAGKTGGVGGGRVLKFLPWGECSKDVQKKHCVLPLRQD